MDTLVRLQEIFRAVFQEESLTISSDDRLQDIGAGDWLMRVTLMQEAESAFRVDLVVA